jgi:hypothetical protein
LGWNNHPFFIGDFMRDTDLLTLDSKLSTEVIKSSPLAVSAAGRRQETADDYPHVVVMLDAKTRVIAADIQWIIQRRRRGGRWPWLSDYYCRSKAGLLRFVPPVPEILALPDWFNEEHP